MIKAIFREFTKVGDDTLCMIVTKYTCNTWYTSSLTK